MRRYRPDIAFPAYAFLPGHNPHPIRNPNGHSYGNQPHSAGAYSGPLPDWCEDSAYLYGVDLYHAGYFWEAHEVWEGCWRDPRAQPIRRAYFKGLIQLAAALLHLRMGRFHSFRRVGLRGLAQLEAVARDHPCFMGLALDPLIASWSAMIARGEPAARAYPDLDLTR